MQTIKRSRSRWQTDGSAAPASVRGSAAGPLLTSSGPGRTVLQLAAKHPVFSQGEAASAVYFIESGRIQISVVSQQGKEAVIAILSAGDFLGEGCIAGQATYHASAVTMTDCTLVRISREAMLRLIQEQPAVSEAFMKFLLSRSVRIEADLIDQLFNSSERRLARVLLLLADFGTGPKAEAVIPRISQEVLAARVGTTRSRINFFMTKFRRLGLVEYDYGSETLTVYPALLNVILHD